MALVGNQPFHCSMYYRHLVVDGITTRSKLALLVYFQKQFLLLLLVYQTLNTFTLDILGFKEWGN